MKDKDKIDWGYILDLSIHLFVIFVILFLYREFSDFEAMVIFAFSCIIAFSIINKPK